MHKGFLFIIILSKLITSILTNPIPESARPEVGSTTTTMKSGSENNTHLHQYQERFPLLWVEIVLAVAFSIGAASFAISMSVPELLDGHDIKRDVNVSDHGTINLGQKTCQYNYDLPQINALKNVLTVTHGDIQVGFTDGGMMTTVDGDSTLGVEMLAKYNTQLVCTVNGSMFHQNHILCTTAIKAPSWSNSIWS